MMVGRNLLQWTASAALALLWIACGPVAAPAPAPPAETGAAPEPPAHPQPGRGGVLAYASSTDPVSLHPFQAATAGARRAVGPIYDLLLTYRYEPGLDYTIDYAAVPNGLAARWEQTDTTTYLFHLRDGVRWQDGVDFTADDVVFTLEFARDPKTAWPNRGRLGAIQAVEKVDSRTVRLTTRGPAPALLQNLADPNSMIVPKHVVDRGDDLAKVAIGTGPFKHKSFDAASKGVLVRHDAYWQQGKPYLDGIEVYYNLDASTRLAGFTARRFDIWSEPDKAQTDAILKLLPDVLVERVLPSYGEALIMQLTRPPYSDIRVRRALHLGVDRQGIIKTATHGEGMANPPGMPGKKEGWSIPQAELLKLPGYRQPKDQDIAEAKRLLAEAGYPGGFSTVVTYDSTRPLEPKIVEAFASSLRSIGVNMELRGRPRAEAAKDLTDGNFETAFDLTADDNLPARQRAYLHSTGSQNRFGLQDAVLDGLLDRLAVTIDVAEQKRLALEMQRHLLEQLYLIPTVEGPGFKLRQPWVHGFVPHVSIAPFIDSAQAPSVWLDVEKMPPDRR